MNVKVPKDGDEFIKYPEQLADIMQRVLLRENKIGRNQEHFWVVGLDSASKLLFVELIGLGRSNRVHADAPTIFRMAIYKMAVSVIFVHNHPSGNMTASEADIDMTTHQYKAGKILNIDVIDHLIISETDFMSFDQKDMMKEIKYSDLYSILSKEEQMLNEFKSEAMAEKAALDRAKEIAKKMKEIDMDIDTIKKLTGLGKVEIKKL